MRRSPPARSGVRDRGVVMPKVLYSCTPCLFSLYFANYLVRVNKVPVRSLLLSTRPLRLGKEDVAGPRALSILVRRLGWRYSSYLVFVVGLASAFAVRRSSRLSDGEVLSFEALARAFDIRIIRSSDFNAPDTVREVERERPDYFLSMFLDQILRKDLLSLPGIAFLNLHPSRLPEFRGADPVSQLMLSDVREYGVTLHEMTTRVDAGDIVSFAALPRDPAETHLGLTLRAAALGAELFSEHVSRAGSGRALPPVRQVDDDAVRHGYRSYPTPADVAAIYANGGRLWSVADVRRALRLLRSAGPE